MHTGTLGREEFDRTMSGAALWPRIITQEVHPPVFFNSSRKLCVISLLGTIPQAG